MTAAHCPVVVIGGGAAGLLAATRAAERGSRVLLLEKNRQPGVKILMSGGTRCNLTQATDARGIVRAFGMPGPFLHSALAQLDPQGVVDYVEAEGVPTKVEPSGKIFPRSDRAADILAALLARLKRSGAELALEEPVVQLNLAEGGWSIATTTRTVSADAIVVTTGGQSYPGCGTTGEGYRWLERLGHTVASPRPALVPLCSAANWTATLRGVTLADVSISLEVRSGPNGEARLTDPVLAPRGKAAARNCRGSFLFTHFGCSGPAVLDISRAVAAHPHPEQLDLVCDFLPAQSLATVREELQRLAASAGSRQLGSLVYGDFPRRFWHAVLGQAGISETQRVAEWSRESRTHLASQLKSLHIPLSGTRGFAQAEVTAGGVALEEVDSRTMSSRIHPGLYLAGEILDLDGPIGGYNFQAAFSTGWLAGEHASAYAAQRAR